MDKKTCRHCSSDQLYWSERAFFSTDGSVSLATPTKALGIKATRSGPNVGALYCANCRRVVLVAHDSDDKLAKWISTLTPVNP